MIAHPPAISTPLRLTGIRVTERGNVLGRLYHLESGRSTPGNGLGLSMVAAIGELHGPKLTLSDNAPGLIVSMLFPATP